MQRNGDNGLHAGPDVLLPGQAAHDEFRQDAREHRKPSILIEQDDVLDDPIVPGRGPVLCKPRPIRQAIRAQVGLTGSSEKASAAEAERGICPFQLLEAAPADDPLPGLLEQGFTDLAGGREEEEFPELSPAGKPPGQERGQTFSSSFFC
jgi:hypothetical protein